MNKTIKAELVRQLKAEIRVLEIELERGNQDLDALKRTLARFDSSTLAPSEAHQTELREVINVGKKSRALGEDTIPSLAETILREAGKPLTTPEIVAAFAQRGKPTGSSIILSSLYRNAKNGKRFRLISTGVFGLLEWPEKEQ
jgi:hypothetical protein